MEIDDGTRREVQAYFSFVAGAETDRAVRARTYHVLREFSDADFAGVLDAFDAVDATATVAFLGRDADDRASLTADVVDRGHEVACHGHRHVSFGELSSDVARADLSTAAAAIEAASDVRPTGFFAPFKGTSEGTLRAASELDFEWVLGSPDDAAVPADLRVLNSVYPHDTRLLEGGTSPAATFERLEAAAEPGATFLFHPNMLEYYDAMAEFEAWIEAVQPVSVGEQLAGGGEDAGVVLDCLRPMRIV